MRDTSVAIVTPPSNFADATNHRVATELGQTLKSLGHSAVIASNPHMIPRVPFNGVLFAAHGPDATLFQHTQTWCKQHGVPYVGPAPSIIAKGHNPATLASILFDYNLPTGACGTEETETSEANHRRVQVVLHAGEPIGAIEKLCHGNGEFEEICPPEMTTTQLRGLYRMARLAATALGADDHYMCIEFIIHPRHNEFISQVDVCPPLHQGSTVARIAQAKGISYSRFIADLIRPLVPRQPNIQPNYPRVSEDMFPSLSFQSQSPTPT